MNGTYYGRNTVTGKKVDGRAEMANNHTTDWTWGERAEIRPDFRQTPHRLHGSLLHAGDPVYSRFAERRGLRGTTTRASTGWTAPRTKIAISSSFWKENMVSGMFRVNYSFNSKYLLTVTGRADSFSAFAENHKWAFFPSAAVAWHLGEELHQGQRLLDRHAEDPPLIRRQREQRHFTLSVARPSLLDQWCQIYLGRQQRRRQLGLPAERRYRQPRPEVGDDPIRPTSVSTSSFSTDAWAVRSTCISPIRTIC